MLISCLKLHTVFERRDKLQRASLAADGVSRLLFLAAAIEGEVETEVEIPRLLELNIQAGKPAHVCAKIGEVQVKKTVFLPLPLIFTGSSPSPSRLRILKSRSLLLVEAS